MLIVHRVRDAEGDDIYRISLCCAVCRLAAGVAELHLAFAYPRTQEDRVTPVWAHKRCLDGRAQALLGTKRVVMIKGLEALRRLMPQSPGLDANFG